MNKKQKKQLFKIVIGILLVALSFFVPLNNKVISSILLITAYFIVGYDIILKAIRNIFKGKIFDENFLMSVATIGAFYIGELSEAVAVMLFYQVGELFQSYAVSKSRKSVANLMDIRPNYANLYRDKQAEKVNPNEVKIGDIILIKPGEKIPLDGVIIEGESLLNTTALTGESLPKGVKVDDEVLSGCINHEGILKVRVTKEFRESTVSKILDLVENASSRKSKSENFISKFAKVYTPIVVIIALILAIVPLLIIKDTSFTLWLYRALSFLVVSCPCALVISIPLSFFGGIGAASKIGVLIKGSNYLEALADAKIVVCDKTGTLTEGIFKVQKVDAIEYSTDDLLEYATYAESFSNHPISLSLKQAYSKEITEKLVKDVKEFSGKGVKAIVGGRIVLVGNEKLMKEYKIEFQKNREKGTVIYVAIDNKFAGTIIIADKIKDDSYQAIKLLRKNHIKKIVMLTGDNEIVSKEIAKELKIEEYHSQLLPQDKVEWVEKLMKKNIPGRLIFVGDGINDAPVLAMSDIGVAMGGLGSDAAIEAADVVIMSDELSKIATSIQISKKTMKIVRENIIFAIVVKIIVLLLSAIGITNMWMAVFADVGVSILAILNALRILNFKGDKVDENSVKN